MKSKMRLGLTVGCIFTILVIIYRTLGDGSNSDIFPKPVESSDWNIHAKPAMLVNLNDAMSSGKSLSGKKPITFESEALPRSADGEPKKIHSTNAHEESNAIAERSENGVKNSKSTPSAVLPHVFVHLDLKGAPPLISYYEQIFPILVKLGVTGLLVEYEDMFPYWGSLRDLSALNSYSQQEVQQLVHLAKKNGLEIMPLVQTFGHMEFVLKHSTFAHLREMAPYPQVICPSQNDTFALITTMIDQILALHPKIKWLHIGADEVYYLGQCSICQQRMAAFNWEKDRLFLEHVKTIAMYVKSRYGVQPIMWDDMFRLMPEEEIRSSGIAKHIEVMAWRYGRDILSELTHEVWIKYGNLFSGNIWIASAFKGATGPAQFITLISHHMENHNAWMDIIKTYNSRLHIRGITLTGWQRFDHFAVLCELFAASFPSLAINLLFLQTGMMEPSLISKATRILDCTQPITLEFDTSTIVRCNYPGSRVYEGVQQLYNIHQEVINMESSSHISGWLNQYNIDTRFSSPALLETANQRVVELKRNLTVLRDDMEHALSAVYDRYTVSEWLQLNLQQLEKKADVWLAGIQDLLSQSTWPRRPLSYNRTSSPTPSFHRDIL